MGQARSYDQGPAPVPVTVPDLSGDGDWPDWAPDIPAPVGFAGDGDAPSPILPESGMLPRSHPRFAGDGGASGGPRPAKKRSNLKLPVT